MTYYVGVDIGTSSVKLLLIDAEGAVLARRKETYSLSQPQPGWLEIDPGLWFEAVMAGLDKLLGEVDRQAVGAVGFTGQMHTAVFLDENGRSIRPAISWNDTRTADAVQRLKRSVAEHGELAHIGGILSTGSPAANLLWMRENEPENFRRLGAVLIGPDYLTYRFSGKRSTDYCEATTSSLFDIRDRQWSSRMCDMIGLPQSVLPKVYGAGQVVGDILPAVAQRLGLPGHVRIIAGTGDNPATYLSSGQLESGEPMISLGTSGILMFSRDEEISAAKGKPILFSTDNQTFHTIVQGAVQSTGSSFRWWAQDILQSGHFDEVSDLVDCERPVNKQLLFYPHLAGDKTIHADPYLRGAFIGIGTDCSREEGTRAIMEGIGFAFRQLMEKMHVNRDLHAIKVTGGMSCMPALMQIFADILGVRIDVPQNISAAQGVALLAARSCQAAGEATLAQREKQQVSAYLPRRQFVEMYGEKYAMYTRIYDSLKQIYT